MKIIIYYHKEASMDGENLIHVIGKELPCMSMEIFCGIEALKGRLKNISLYPEEEVFLLLANSYRQLSELICLAKQIEGRRLILIVPDELVVFLKKALLLYPRFIARPRTDYAQLCRVLDKMMTMKP